MQIEMRLRWLMPQALLLSMLFFGSLCFTSSAEAFESAKVLPAGVRSVNLRSVSADIEEKTDQHGHPVPLSEPLQQQLTFAKIAKGEEAVKATQLRAFLDRSGFVESESVGEFKADLKGRVTVLAPLFSYGVNDKLTIAVAAPYYRASTSVQVGFQPNARAQAFLNSLADPENNQVAAAREAGDKLNNAVRELNQKLADNGFRALSDWDGQGFGDMTLAAKYRFFENDRLASAVTGGVVAPTGRQDDPDILNDLAFGDGQWDVFSQVSCDEPIPGSNGALFLNQFAKYTAQLPAKKSLRLVTADEKIEVSEDTSRFKLGDKFDAGVSMQWQPDSGILTGLGYTFYKKFGDIYRDVAAETKGELEQGTDQIAHNGEVAIGYSTLPAYRRGAIAAPLEMKLTYANQLASRNMPVTDLIQFDVNLYF